MREEIIARAPARISFAGGGTDIPPFDADYGGQVISATINKIFEARLRKRDDEAMVIRTNRRPLAMIWLNGEWAENDGTLDFVKELARTLHVTDGFELDLHSPVAHRTGLGGSAAMAVAVAGAFNQVVNGHHYHTPKELAEVCWHIENNVLGNACGRQDHYAAACGGLNWMHFHGGSSVEVNPIGLAPMRRHRIEKSLALIDLGARQEDSGKIIAGMAATSADGTCAALIETRKRVGGIHSALVMGDWENFGRAIDGLWQFKKQLHPAITNERIDALYEDLKGIGVIGGKVTGAGGGGHMLIVFDPDDRVKIITKAPGIGATFIPVAFYDKGLTISRRPLPGG